MHIFYYKKVVEWNEMVSVVWHGSDVIRCDVIHCAILSYYFPCCDFCDDDERMRRKSTKKEMK